MSNWQTVFSPTILRGGFAFWNDDRVNLVSVDSESYIGRVTDSKQYLVTVKKGAKGRLVMSCDCPYSERSNCKHQAAVLFQIQDTDPDFLGIEEEPEEAPAKKEEPKEELKSDEMITDMMGQKLLDASRKNLRIKPEEISLEMPVLKSVHRTDSYPVDIIPVLNMMDASKPKVEFSIKRDHNYVIRNIRSLYEDYKNKAVREFGKNLTVDFATANFTDLARRSLRFIEKSAQPKGFFNYEASGSYVRELILDNNNIDDFFELFSDCGSTIMSTYKKKVHFRELKPSFDSEVLPVTKGKRLVAVSVEFKPPFVHCGKTGMYFIDLKTESFNKVESNDCGPLGDILKQTSRPAIVRCRIGLDQLKDFEYTTLPALRWYGNTVMTKCPDLSGYINPKPQFFFNLDYVRHVVECKAEVHYGSKVVTIRNVYQFQGGSESTSSSETEVVLQLERIFDYREDDIWYINDPDSTYLLITRGLEILKSIGTVNVTSAFESLKIKKAPKTGTSVSLEGNLLELSIKTEDMDLNQLLDLLDSYKKKKVYHRLRDGSFIDLSGEYTDSTEEAASLMQLETLVTDLGVSKSVIKGGKITVPSYRAMYIDGMIKDRELSDVERTSAFEALLDRFEKIKKTEISLPTGITAQLREYQKTGFGWMYMLAECGFGGILADDMGLGKTLQTITYIQSLKESGKLKTALVVCPSSLVFNWAAEAARFAPGLSVITISGKQLEREAIISECEKYDLVITSYDLLRRDILLYEGHRFTLQVLDEAQFIKNHNTDAARAVKLISSDIHFALTGTPIENRLSELWSIFDFLMPSFLFTQSTFRSEFEVPVMKDHDKFAMDRLRHMTSPFIMRRLKTDVLKDLPEKLQEDRVAKFGEQQQKLYDAQVAKIRTSIRAGSSKDFNENKIAILAEITRLRQICCDPSLVFEDYSGESSKRAMCLDLVSSAIEGGHRVLLFSQFTSMLSLIEKDLKENNIEYFKITGSTDKKERLELVDSFNNGTTPVFLISLKAGGTGLNLTGADVVIHYDPWWNTAVQNQATDRAHRIGQTRVVNVFRLIAKDSIEEKIVQLQQKKSDLADGILSGEGVNISSLSADELLEILS